MFSSTNANKNTNFAGYFDEMDNLLHEYILYQGDFTGASARKNHSRVIQYCVAAKIIHSRVIQYRVIAETIKSRVIKCCVATKTIHSSVIQRSVAASQWYCFYPFIVSVTQKSFVFMTSK